MSKHSNKYIKTKYNAKMNEIVQRDKSTENERKCSKKENEKRKKIGKEKTKTKNRSNTIEIYGGDI